MHNSRSESLRSGYVVRHRKKMHSYHIHRRKVGKFAVQTRFGAWEILKPEGDMAEDDLKPSQATKKSLYSGSYDDSTFAFTMYICFFFFLVLF